MKNEKEEEGGNSKDRQYVTALARGLQVLRCFGAEHPTLGTAEIARMTGLAQATVWRLCHVPVPWRCASGDSCESDRVRAFAEWITEQLERMITSEQRRADEGLALRKYQYGVGSDEA